MVERLRFGFEHMTRYYSILRKNRKKRPLQIHLALRICRERLLNLPCAQRFEAFVQLGHLCNRQQLQNAVLWYTNWVPRTKRWNPCASAFLCRILFSYWQDAFDEFAFYGGMPLILSRPSDAAKMAYLKSLFSEVYLKDIVERKKIKREDVLSAILDLLCSSIGSFYVDEYGYRQVDYLLPEFRS